MAIQQLPVPTDAIAPPLRIQARRIGLIGDDHNELPDGSDLPAEVLTAFEGLDAIIHLGHMGVKHEPARGVLDRLGSIAPVYAVRDYSLDVNDSLQLSPADGERVAGLSRVIEAGGLRIGAIHNPARPPGPEIPTPPGGLPELHGLDVRSALAEKFGGPVDVVAYAGSHRPVAILARGVLWVNPGSPTYPKGPGRLAGKRALGTVGILDVSDGICSFEVIDLAVLAAASAASAG